MPTRVSLKETLEAATREGVYDEESVVTLKNLAPELGALVLDMGEYLRLHAYRMPEFSWEEEATCRVCASPASKGHNEVCPLGALLARLDQLGKEPA